MPRRIDIELTSALSDGSWTWRAAGARNPKGTLDGSILPADASVGDTLKVEAEQMLDGMEILSVVKGREKSAPTNVLELLPDERPFEAVIETRAQRDRGERRGREGRGDRDGRGPRRDGEGRGPRRDGEGRGRDGEGRGPRRDGEGRGRDGDSRGPRGDGRGRDGDSRGERSDRPRRPHFEAPPEVPQRPKPKRLRPGKARRQEVLAAVPEEQRQIAELALQGLAAVRTRVKEENATLTAAGKPTMPEASILKMAEEMLPKLRVADWLDRAEAAQRQMQHLDLRDLRSVVAASDDSIVARDESTRQLAEELKAALVTKQAEEMSHWLEDVEAALGVGRVIRALRLSSQPPKAGVMFPPDLARRLGEAATASLLPDDSGERWSALLEAAAFSPVRTLIAPATPPTTVSEDLAKTVRRLGPLLPQVAALLGIEVPKDAKRPKPLRPTGRKDAKKPGEAGGDRPRGERGERSERGRDRSEPRPPRDRPKGMRDVSTMPKPGDDAPNSTEDPTAADSSANADDVTIEAVTDTPATEPTTPDPAETTDAAASEPEPAAEPEPETAAEPEPEAETAAEPEPEPEPETAAEPEPAAEPELETAAESAAEPDTESTPPTS